MSMIIARSLTGKFGKYCEKCIKRSLHSSSNRKVYFRPKRGTSSDNVKPFNYYSQCRSVSVFSKYYVTCGRRLLFYSKTSLPVQKNLSSWTLSKYTLYKHPGYTQNMVMHLPTRHLSIGVRFVSVAGKLIRLRYIVVTAIVGTGITISQKMETFKESLPDLSWLRGYIPESETVSKFTERFLSTVGDMRETLPNTEWVKEKISKLPSLEDIFGDRSSTDFTSFLSNGQQVGHHLSTATMEDAGFLQGSVFPERTTSDASEHVRQQDKKSTEKAKMEELQEDMVKTQIRYQQEVDRLEKENRELRKQLLLKDGKTSSKKQNFMKSPIDLYSEVLDELSEYDSSYNTQDHLPRIVVVGDQSSGKTSVLEMIAQARIFPRGSGEMMTRSAVKVTLSEGPYHIAQFKDSSREFDLTKDNDLSSLRKEIEVRMKSSLMEGQTISNECISLSVKGPGLQRMVLVDLPGIISTVTTEMAPDTRDSIKSLCKTYMENPNAIILCIQDGSLDAERSNVTDLVSSMDPGGRRTIFVLTKVDLAESSLYNPHRIKQILEGKLFPMKALGYFAVVTGKGNTNDSIQTIKEYEKNFFSSSRLFKDGVLKTTQMTTGNLSMMVSSVFWNMVQASVEQQADAFRATRFNLETEWKNTFPKLRQLDREELFEKARSEILDEIINLSQVTPRQWEAAFSQNLWDRVSDYVFEDIYLPASQTDNIGVFNTTVDIKLKHWADKLLPHHSVQVGWETLQEKFVRLMDKDHQCKDHDDIFDKIKSAVKDDSMLQHKWDEKAEDSLRVIQVNALEDRSVVDKHQWDAAIQFMEDTVSKKLLACEKKLADMEGPSTTNQWLKWQAASGEQKMRRAALTELQSILTSQPGHRTSLAHDELTAVRKNLQTKGIDVTDDFIRETWHSLYRQHFYKRSLFTAQQCKKGFYYYQKGFIDAGIDCHEVVLFWRIQRMLHITSNALRQQVINNEARRLERNIKSVLDAYSEDKTRVKSLLTGRRVLLADELKRVRHIQDKLEEFMHALNKERKEHR